MTITAVDEFEGLKALVERFEQNLDAYRSGRYNETQLRREFVDPLFKLLGWDISNEQGYAEPYKDVIHEDSIKVGAATKAPDYCFRIGGTRKFFVESKKPSVNIKGDPAPAFQLRRYAWSAKLPLSILTDFEEFAVYDCRVKPDQSDKASKARILYLTYNDYLERWDEIRDIFSRESLLKGSFDKYAESTKRKRGTAEVDDAFLEDIESWRTSLAKNIALRNSAIEQFDLNFSVQRIIDRVIFLRICEARSIEDYGSLMSLVNGPGIYARLVEQFKHADDRYNSGLFHFKDEHGRHSLPDELTTRLIIDDKPLREMIRGLYYPQSPYEFSVLPSDILGQVYERFLGKVIRLTSSHQAKVEEKPEVRKAGGVYYTPTAIVNDVIEKALGSVLEGKSPKEVGAFTETWQQSKSKGARPITIIDCACGSGSFLIGAYQYLLDWYLEQYLLAGQEYHSRGRDPRVYQHQSGGWRLTTSERKRILTTHIFGVDIDPQAVEVTKMSLLLKVLEGETDQSLSTQFSLLGERALPDLGENIKCGNSLISSDYRVISQGGLFEKDDLDQIRPFDWAEEFPGPLGVGGFTCVLGNPPWGQKEIDSADVERQYYRQNYKSIGGIFDLFRPFVERSIALTAPGGSWGLVLPDIILLKDYQPTRALMLDELTMVNIDWWGMAFKDAVIDAVTFVARRERASERHEVEVSIHSKNPMRHRLRQSGFRENERLAFNLFLSESARATISHLAQFNTLDDYFEIHEGVHSGNIRAELFVDVAVDDTCQPLFFGRDEIRPYVLRWNGKFIRLGAVPKKKTKERYANVGQPEWYLPRKILVRRTGDYILAAVDDDGRYASNNFFVLTPKDANGIPLDAVSALLNSEFMTWYFRTIEPRKGRVFAEVKIKHLRCFPIPDWPKDKDIYARLERLSAQRKNAEITARPLSGKRHVSILDREIDQVVCDAFGIRKDGSGYKTGGTHGKAT